MMFTQFTVKWGCLSPCFYLSSYALKHWQGCFGLTLFGDHVCREPPGASLCVTGTTFSQKDGRLVLSRSMALFVVHIKHQDKQMFSVLFCVSCLQCCICICSLQHMLVNDSLINFMTWLVQYGDFTVQYTDLSGFPTFSSPPVALVSVSGQLGGF